MAAGSVLGYFARQSIARKQAGTIEAKLQKMTEDAKQEARETMIQAKDKAMQFLEEAKREQKERELSCVKKLSLEIGK